MSDETKVNEAEENTEEQPAAETQTEEDAPVLEESPAESVPQAEAEAAVEPEAEAVAEPEAEAVAEPEVEAVAEPVAEAVAETEAEPVAETVSEGAEEAADEASAESDADSSQPEQPVISFNRVEGPAIFNRAKQGNQRRNPRHVGNDVRIDEIGYKNVQVLSRFVDNYGRIHNRRKTRVTAKMQRKVTRAIKRARHLALMPYTGEHIRITGRRG
jgi:ribosomal protein S18